MGNKRAKLRFAVLVEGNLLKQWQVQSIQSVIDSNTAELIQIIENNGSNSYDSSKLSLSYRVLDKLTRNSGPLTVVDISDKFEGVERIKVKANKKGISNYFKTEDIQNLQELKLDFILRFGFGILKGEILTVAKHGVWSYHHGNPLKFRGGPAAFWEIYEGEAVTGAILQQINEKLDSGVILKKGFYRSISNSFKASSYHVLEESKSWAAQVSKRIYLNPKTKLKFEEISSTAPIYKAPSNYKVIKLYFILLRNKFRFHWISLFRAERWNVGVIDQPLEEVVENDTPIVEWVKKSKDSIYWADPFALSDTEIVFEDYDYKRQKGILKRISFGDYSNSKLFFEKQTHLSYPYIISKYGNKYVLPENYRNDALIMYKIEDNKPSKEYKILKGNWIDPTLIYHDNHWWLFCTSQQSPNEKLYLFYSEKIIGPYIEHPLNPIITDIRSARPAGTPFYIGEKLYRPGQNCSKTYGEAIRIKRIQKLSTTDYSETSVKELRADKFNTFNKGIHTISAFGNRTLIDAKQYYFDFAHFKNQLSGKLKRIIKR